MSDYTLFCLPRTKGPSHALLSRCAAEFTGDPEAARWPVETGRYGKPCFPGHDRVQFSITHSGDYWMCAFGSRPVGLDLQQEVPCSREALSWRFFHPQEHAFLQSVGFAAFFPLWAAKESYLKYTGRGLSMDLHSFCAATLERGLLPEVSGAQLRPLPFQPGYSLCLCAEEIGSVRLRW